MSDRLAFAAGMAITGLMAFWATCRFAEHLLEVLPA